MEHVVFFPAPDGSPAFRRLPTLEESVRFVERLRNTEGVSEFSLHALTPVPLAMRAYYRVEPVSLPAPAPAPDAVASRPAAPGEPLPEVAAAEVAAAEVAAAEEPTVADFFVASEPEPQAQTQAVGADAELSAPMLDERLAVAHAAPAAEPVLPNSENGSGGRRGLGFFSR
ncbi:MAG: hypothetical protein ACYCO3_12430 [Mycobacteriales bacterium]